MLARKSSWDSASSLFYTPRKDNSVRRKPHPHGNMQHSHKSFVRRSRLQDSPCKPVCGREVPIAQGLLCFTKRIFHDAPQFVFRIVHPQSFPGQTISSLPVWLNWYPVNFTFPRKEHPSKWLNAAWPPTTSAIRQCNVNRIAKLPRRNIPSLWFADQCSSVGAAGHSETCMYTCTTGLGNHSQNWGHLRVLPCGAMGDHSSQWASMRVHDNPTLFMDCNGL